VIEFLKMGKYAAYVWPAYGITLLILLGSAWAARRRRTEALRRLLEVGVDQRPRRQPTVRQVE
jgi:heme exporter protein CcmD